MYKSTCTVSVYVLLYFTLLFSHYPSLGKVHEENWMKKHPNWILNTQWCLFVGLFPFLLLPSFCCRSPLKLWIEKEQQQFKNKLITQISARKTRKDCENWIQRCAFNFVNYLIKCVFAYLCTLFCCCCFQWKSFPFKKAIQCLCVYEMCILF